MTEYEYDEEFNLEYEVCVHCEELMQTYREEVNRLREFDDPKHGNAELRNYLQLRRTLLLHRDWALEAIEVHQREHERMG